MTDDFWMNFQPIMWAIGFFACVALIASLIIQVQKYGKRQYNAGVMAGYTYRQCDEASEQQTSRR